MAKRDWGAYWDAFVDAKGRCTYCDTDLGVADTAETFRYHVDHLVPKGKAGPRVDDPLNRVLACHACNHIKTDWDPSEGHSAPSTAEERRTYIARTRERLREQRQQWKARWAGDVAAMVAESRARHGDG